MIPDQYCSVEFSISKDEPNYLFKIRDISSSGLCNIAKEGSAVLSYLKVGDTIDMRYYYQEKADTPELNHPRLQGERFQPSPKGTLNLVI